MVQDYLGLKHDYQVTNCITLIQSFYKKELGIDFTTPDYPKSRRWLKSYDPFFMNEWVSKDWTKVRLTDAKNYDVMIFNSEKTKLITHFGMYLMPSRMLHIEEGGFSCVQTLSDYWVENLCMICRHNDLV